MPVVSGKLRAGQILDAKFRAAVSHIGILAYVPFIFFSFQMSPKRSSIYETIIRKGQVVISYISIQIIAEVVQFNKSCG
jgi:hypothetical protein